MIFKAKTARVTASLPEWVIAIALSLFIGFLLLLSSELKGIYKIALLGGTGGTIFLISYPKRRIVLVAGWILLLPLSIEKVFFIGEPLWESFFPPVIVVSASDVMLFFLALEIIFAFLLKKDSYRLHWHGALTPYLILSIWAVIVFFIRNPDTTSTLAIFHNIKIFFFLFILSSSVRTPGELKCILYAICFAVLIQAVIVGISFVSESAIRVSAKVSGELISFSGSKGGMHIRAAGTVGHVNQEASFLTFFGAPLIALIFSKNKIFKYLGIVAVIGSTVAIGLTFSRSAWLSIVIATICVIIIAIRKKELVFKHWIYTMPFLMAGLVIFSIFFRPMVDRLFYGDEGATSSRKRAIILAWDLFEKHPVTGIGQGNFVKASLHFFPPEKKDVAWLTPGEVEREITDDYGRLEISQIRREDKLYTVPLPVHNKYVLVLCELGIIGLLFFLWFQYRIFLHLKKCLTSKETMTRWLAIGLTGAFAASQCYMNLELFYDDKTMQILLIIAVLAMITDNVGKRHGFQQ